MNTELERIKAQNESLIAANRKLHARIHHAAMLTLNLLDVRSDEGSPPEVECLVQLHNQSVAQLEAVLRGSEPSKPIVVQCDSEPSMGVDGSNIAIEDHW